MIKVAPSILSADFSNLERDIKIIEPYVSYLHIDVMDGHFVPNLTIGAPVIKCIRNKSQLIFDTHLMISNPVKYVNDFIDAGSDYVTVHVEANKPLEAIKMIKSRNVKAGISIKPDTPISTIIDFLPLVDLVLVMSVNPGFGGQKFMDVAIKKVRDLYSIREENGYSYLISVDGGINDKTAILVNKADILVAGSYVFKSEDKKEAIRRIECAR